MGRRPADGRACGSSTGLDTEGLSRCRRVFHGTAASLIVRPQPGYCLDPLPFPASHVHELPQPLHPLATHHFPASASQEVQIETGDIQVLLKQRASLLVMSEAKKWEDRGRGMLTLRQPRSGGQPFLVFTTDTGRVLVNAPLVRGMKPTGNPKTPRNLVMALHNAVGGGPPAHGMYIFKAEDAEAAKALRGAILQHV